MPWSGLSAPSQPPCLMRHVNFSLQKPRCLLSNPIGQWIRGDFCCTLPAIAWDRNSSLMSSKTLFRIRNRCPFPILNSDGFLPPGIHAASLRETLVRYDDGSQARQRQGNLLRLIVGGRAVLSDHQARTCLGRFIVTAEPEPNDLHYSIVVRTAHRLIQVAAVTPAILCSFRGAAILWRGCKLPCNL